MKRTIVNITQTKTQLSSLMDRALQGEIIVISKPGLPLIRLLPLEKNAEKRELGFLDFPLEVDFDQRILELLDFENMKR